MFIQPKIRGVPLNALVLSGFFPQILLLAKRWHEKNCGENPIKHARPRYWTKALALILSASGLCLLSAGSAISSPFTRVSGDPAVGAWVFLLGLFCFTVDTLMQPWSFARAVNRLDECLRRECAGGIARLPYTDVPIVFERFLRDKMTQGAYLVLFNEGEKGRESFMAKYWLAFMTDLGSIAQEFGHDLGEWNPYFEAAAERLAREKEEKENSLPDHAPVKT